jgi:hypothetical protein
MNKEDCGSCDYQGRVEQKRAECRIDFKWHERPHFCGDFKDYVQGKSNGTRLAEAQAVRAERRALKLAAGLQKERMEFETKMWRQTLLWQFILTLMSAGLGFLVGWLLKP